jgi:hypothetical protein
MVISRTRANKEFIIPAVVKTEKLFGVIPVSQRQRSLTGLPLIPTMHCDV